MSKVALINGVTDKTVLTAEFRWKKRYEVHVERRRASSFNTERVIGICRSAHLQPGLHLHYGDSE